MHIICSRFHIYWFYFYEILIWCDTADQTLFLAKNTLFSITPLRDIFWKNHNKIKCGTTKYTQLLFYILFCQSFGLWDILHFSFSAFDCISKLVSTGNKDVCASLKKVQNLTDKSNLCIILFLNSTPILCKKILISAFH
mgnify:CR=1 FL=1